MKKILISVFAFIIIIPIIIWLFSLIKCEVLTKKYYNEFSKAYTQNVMIDEIESFKVIKCNKSNAKVYYIVKDMACAHILEFVNTNNGWTEKSWETVWSKSGSASDIVFPYWWHFIYAGF